MLIKIEDKETKHSQNFTTIKEFIEFLKPIAKNRGLEIIYKE